MYIIVYVNGHTLAAVKNFVNKMLNMVCQDNSSIRFALFDHLIFFFKKTHVHIWLNAKIIIKLKCLKLEMTYRHTDGRTHTEQKEYRLYRATASELDNKLWYM